MNARSCSRKGCADPVVGRKLCRRHYQAAWKAGEFVNNPLPPRKPGRTICPDHHKHEDSTTCYIQHQCRCVPCKEHHSVMARSLKRLRAYGRFDTGLVDAAPVREHMMMLAEFGMGYKRIAKLAGIGVTPTRNLIWGRQEPGPRYGEMQKRVKRETAEALLSVRPEIENLAPGANTPARGVHRRVQALAARGWSVSRVGAECGVTPANFHTMMHRDSVLKSTHDLVAAVYNRLWNVVPPHSEWREKTSYARTLKYAKVRRWLPPLAWDDIDIDVEPPVVEDIGGIDDMAVELAMHGEVVRLTSAERHEAIRRLHESRWSDSRIAEALHVADRTVWRIRRELGLVAFDQSDLLDRGDA